MASMAEVKAFIKSNFEVEAMDSGGLTSSFTFGDGRSQVIFFNFVDEEDYLIISSPFAKLSDVSPKQALEAAAKTTFLGIKLVGSFLAVSHVVPVADLDPSEVAEGVAMVAAAGDVLEERLVGSDNF